ncbi:MAG TPA: hypothetical protein PKZ47_04135 [Alistipes sp.]|uniref:hypothetical protein n=1 Tax=Alistipes sp. TaxID=1872444 RepID=UPI002CE5DCCA|nr:hypothetical protein [Alistipes sp.]HUN14203.1 hypothetical protein [Alistipes sp.]
MKSLKIFILAAVAIVAGLFAACSDDDFKAGPAVSGTQVYFPESIAAEYSIGDEVSEIAIPVMRVVGTEAQTVAVLADDKSGLFTIPASVSFAAGEKKAELLMTFDRTQLEDGTDYPISFLLNDEENTTPYGNSQLAITVTPWPWELLGTGLFRDDWLSSMFNGNSVEIEVQIHKHKSREGVYMIEDMYGWPFLTEFFGGSQADIESKVGLNYTPTNIVLNASDPNAVFFSRQFSGITDKDPDYGDYEIATLKDGEGTLVDGVVTFPVQGLGLFCLKGGQYANKNGNFRILLPGAEIVDYSLAVEYDSMRVDNDGATSAVLTFNYGADVTGIGYVVVPSNISAEERATLAAAIADGSAKDLNKIENLDGSGSVTEKFVLAGSGAHTVVAVANDKNGQPLTADFVAINFFFPGSGGAAAPDCDVQAQLGLPSALVPENAAKYPDQNNLAFSVKGSELQSVRTYLNKTAVIQGAGMTPEQIVTNHGNNISADQLSAANGTGFANIFIELDPDTSYTLIVKATNVYGKSKVVTAECSTAQIDYTGELVIGNYLMQYELTGPSGSTTLKNEFTIVPQEAGNDVDFFVSNLGTKISGISWYAAYDSAASTLTLSGIWKGDENLGSVLGGWIGISETEAVAFISKNPSDDQSKGGDPIVFKVDPATKQLVKLNTNLQVQVGTIEGQSVTNPQLVAIFNADGTTIAFQTGNAGTSSATLRTHGIGAAIPFSSVAGMKLAGGRNLLKSNAVPAGDGWACPVRTLSVKPERCEPSPKTFGRVATFKLVDSNARLAK